MSEMGKKKTNKPGKWSYFKMKRNQVFLCDKVKVERKLSRGAWKRRTMFWASDKISGGKRATGGRKNWKPGGQSRTTPEALQGTFNVSVISNRASDWRSNEWEGKEKMEDANLSARAGWGQQLMAVGGLFSDLTEDPAHVNVSQYFYSSFLRKFVDHSLPESSVRTIPRCHHVPRRAFVLVSSASVSVCCCC